MDTANRPHPGSEGQATSAVEISALENFLRSPHTVLKVPGLRQLRLATDRVRARPAITPQLSLLIGLGAIALGTWGALFPNSVKRTLGLKAPAPAVSLLFGVRELWSGFSLAGNPTRADVLWARVGGDLLDLAVLSDLGRGRSPKPDAARFALKAVLVLTVLDVIAAARMSTVRRNWPEEASRP